VATSRLPHLSPEGHRLAEVAAVFDRSVSVDDAAAVLDEPIARLLAPVRDALDAGVLARNSDVLSFRDSRLRDAIYQGMSEARRADLHGEIGGLLLNRGDMAGAVAHLVRAGRPVAPDTLAALDEATRQLRFSSPESAADLAMRVLSLTTTSEEERFPRVLTAVDALVGAGRAQEAIELAHTAIAAPATPRRIAAKLHLSLARLAVMSGRLPDAVDEADAVLAMTGLSDELYAAAEQTRLLALMADGDFAPAREPAEVILGGAGRAGGDASVGGALTTLGSIAWTEGHVADAIGLFRAAAERAEGEPLELHQLRPRQSLAVVLAATGTFDEARQLLLEERARSVASGDRTSAIAVATWLSRLHAGAGRLPEAMSEGETAVALSQELQATLFVPLARATLAAAALLGGDIALARDECERSRTANTAATSFQSDLCDWVEARVIASQDGAAQAVELMSDVYAHPLAHRRLFLEEAGAAGWLVRTALAVGDGDRAAAVVVAVELLAAENPGSLVLTAVADQARGLVDRDAGALDRAIARHRHPLAAASAAEDAAEVRADRGDGDGARVRLERALDIYRQAGADGEADRVRTTLRDVRVTRGRRSRAQRPAAGWDSLTDSEVHVARLVAEGLTNRQVAERMFLSRHTVDFHLRQVFRKLGINSRVELVAVALEQGDT
jgi:DNA-binding CsgD family transcriptional regulator/tetratricopeptide (TPR) repeat protein